MGIKQDSEKEEAGSTEYDHNHKFSIQIIESLIRFPANIAHLILFLLIMAPAGQRQSLMYVALFPPLQSSVTYSMTPHTLVVD